MSITLDSGTANTLASHLQGFRRLEFDKVRENTRKEEYEKQLSVQQDQFDRTMWSEYERLDEGARQADQANTTQLYNIDTQATTLRRGQDIMSADRNREQDHTEEVYANERRATLVSNAFDANVAKFAAIPGADNDWQEGMRIAAENGDGKVFTGMANDLVQTPYFMAALRSSMGREGIPPDTQVYAKPLGNSGEFAVAWKDKDGQEVYWSKNGKVLADNADEAMVSIGIDDIAIGWDAALRAAGVANKYDQAKLVDRTQNGEAEGPSMDQFVDGVQARTEDPSPAMQQPAPEEQGQDFFGLLPGGGLRAGPIEAAPGRLSVGPYNITGSGSAGSPQFGLSMDIPNNAQPPMRPQEAPAPAAPQVETGPQDLGLTRYSPRALGSVAAGQLYGAEAATNVMANNDVNDRSAVYEAESNRAKAASNVAVNQELTAQAELETLGREFEMGEPAAVQQVTDRLATLSGDTLATLEGRNPSELTRLYRDLVNEGYDGNQDALLQDVMQIASTMPAAELKKLGISDKKSKNIALWGPRELAAVAVIAKTKNDDNFNPQEWMDRKGYRPLILPLTIPLLVKAAGTDLVNAVTRK